MVMWLLTRILSPLVWVRKTGSTFDQVRIPSLYQVLEPARSCIVRMHVTLKAGWTVDSTQPVCLAFILPAYDRPGYCILVGIVPGRKFS